MAHMNELDIAEFPKIPMPSQPLDLILRVRIVSKEDDIWKTAAKV